MRWQGNILLSIAASIIEAKDLTFIGLGDWGVSRPLLYSEKKKTGYPMSYEARAFFSVVLCSFKLTTFDSHRVTPLGATMPLK